MNNKLFSNNAYKTGLEDWLDENQIIEYLNLIKLQKEEPSLDYLRKIIINTFKYIPYQNLTMLTRPRVAPSQEQIIKDMIEGIGGLCTTLNPFMCALLHKLNFKVGLISASMKEPDCHIGIVAELKKMNYWIDFGNGYPYLEPLLLKNGEKHKILNFTYELRCKSDTWHVYQSTLGSPEMAVDQSFKLSLKDYSFFETMRNLHHTHVDYGHFLKTIRINRWEEKKAFVLRDKLVLDIPFSKVKITTKDEGKDWINKHFFKNIVLTKLFDSSWDKIYE